MMSHYSAESIAQVLLKTTLEIIECLPIITLPRAAFVSAVHKWFQDNCANLIKPYVKSHRTLENQLALFKCKIWIFFKLKVVLFTFSDSLLSPRICMFSMIEVHSLSKDLQRFLFWRCWLYSLWSQHPCPFTFLSVEGKEGFFSYRYPQVPEGIHLMLLSQMTTTNLLQCHVFSGRKTTTSSLS